MHLARWFAAALCAALMSLTLPTAAEKKYGPGASDTEIKLGQTMPYSGPASAYGTIGKGHTAYFQMINDQGGVNGRKINLISLDDGYSPPKAVEQVRKLVEEDQVLALFQTLGTPSNSAIHKYVNAKKVPHLFLATGATKWGDPKNFPWTIGWQPVYQDESRIYAKYIMTNLPTAKIGVLYQNDDYGKDLVKGLKDGLGAKGSMIVAEVSYEVTDPTIDSQVVQLQGSSADVFMIFATPKFAAQAIRKSSEVGWKATRFLNLVSSSVGAVLTPAGLDKSTGIITAAYLKDPTDPQWQKDRSYQDWFAWMKKYFPGGDINDGLNVHAYTSAQTMVQVLKQCGDDLSRENIMRQAASLKNLELGMLLPGIRINTTPEDFYPIRQLQLARFDGKRWVLFGELMGQ